MKLLGVFIGFVMMFYFIPNLTQNQIHENIEVYEIDNNQMLLYQGNRIATGVHLRPSFPDYGKRLEQYNSTVEKPAAILMYFLDWSGHPFRNQVFDYTLVQQIRTELSQEEIPAIMLTWQPIIYGNRDEELGDCYANQNGVISPIDIISGKCDQYIRMFAEDISERPERYLIRFAHEMNISDSPWWPGHFNLGADTYVRMWRHVHSVFSQRMKELAKNNAEWVWSINYASYPNEPWNAYYNYYPGDEYVDWIGLSGYNWNNARLPYATFTQIYGEVDGSGASISSGILHDLACRYAKPQIIAEIGTAGRPEQNADWITKSLEKIPSYPFLKGVVWFNDFAYEDINSADFRILNLDPNLPSVDARITIAYKNGINLPFYIKTLEPLSVATPPRVYCGNGDPIFEYPSTIILEPGETLSIRFTALAISKNVELTFLEIPPDFAISPQQYFLPSPWGTENIELKSTQTVREGTYKLKFSFSTDSFPREITIIVVQEKHKIFLPFMKK